MRRFNLMYNRTWSSKPSTFNKTAPFPTYKTQQPQFDALCTARGGKYRTPSQVQKCSSPSNCTVGCSACARCIYEMELTQTPYFKVYPAAGDYIYLGSGVTQRVGRVIGTVPSDLPYGTPAPPEPSSSTTSTRTYTVQLVFRNDACTDFQPSSGVIGTAYGDLCLFPMSAADPSGALIESSPPLALVANVPPKKGARSGAPPRNPLAGTRKQLDCCVDTGTCASCLLHFEIVQLDQGHSPVAGDIVVDSQVGFIGTIAEVVQKKINSPDIYVTPANAYLCDTYVFPDPGSDSPSIRITAGTVGTTGKYSPRQILYVGPERTLDELCKQGVGAVAPKKPTNTVYMDNHARSCMVDKKACYDPRIRSGMQPKPQTCVTDASGNSYRGVGRRRKVMLCPGDPGWRKPYSYSYAQYLHNGSCKSFARSQEKFLPGDNADRGTLWDSGRKNCNPWRFRKSGCDGCRDCQSPCELKISVAATTIPWIVPVQVDTGPADSGPWTPLGVLTRTAEIGVQQTILTVDTSKSGVCTPTHDYLRIPTGGGPGSPLIISPGLWTARAAVKTSDPGRNSVTVWKPSNSKFKVQGAVSAGSRLERLKLDTVRAANSKCPKGKRCRKGTCPNCSLSHRDKGACGRYGKGPYFAGKPRFTGWIYNSRHPETLCMRKYRQVPFGVPQLTRRGRSTRSNRIPGAQPNSASSRRVRAYPLTRQNTNLRAPACKCPAKLCPDPCAGSYDAQTGTYREGVGLTNCGSGRTSLNPGAPCCRRA